MREQQGGRASAPTAAVAEALDQLSSLDQRPVSEHPEVFGEVHRLLQDALATLDEA